ncbi:MAG: hypothetical protein LBQ47_08635 [Endomicrobium sp.]|jgi:hypothetical protein|nr:hypothetical protein [Endomicrobium sp.]
MKKIFLVVTTICAVFTFSFAVEQKIVITPVRAEIAYKAGNNHWGVYNGKPYYYYGNRYHEYYRNGRRHYYYDYYDSYDYQKRKTKAAYSQIDKLEEMKTAAENAKKELKGIKILKAKLSKQYSTDAPAMSVAELTVQNNSNHDITSFYFTGAIITHKTGKNISGGYFEYYPDKPLLAGKKASYKIALNEFGQWAKANQPDLAVLNVTVTGIETSDGQTFTDDIFTSDDQKKLNELKNRYIYQ